MSNQNNGGPAFPLTRESSFSKNYEGMTLRDYFAAGFASAQATTTSADTAFINADYVDPRDGVSVAERIARSSYELADAMLAARG